MFNFFKKKDLELVSPVSGTMIDLTEVPDNVFASGMMGEGVAFKPETSQIVAPADGTIAMIPETLHAFGLTLGNGAEILVHVGIDTVSLAGKGYKVLKKAGDKVKTGDVIIEIDSKFIQEKGYSLITPMIITNSSEYQIELHLNERVTSGKTLVAKVLA
ncbi:PTS glucose transporter subunit IIA [Enterococcus sp. PF-2]|jgi:glucose-specific phosphotransferase system IIA component|uniref:PTS sugar transporter subunit IIA n=1 Tax=unclassified Enterococcus TaxID=2608891 RepID=UPI0011237BEF|nr:MULTISPECIES: PTS glucose transporter subunit IIA [unclassified Enterococcus]TPD98704.1 PTS glucose transporter subunit IIA [Enterococcus sp. PF-3]TPE22895.1 PTS glucose transporter subunit IIA [Enterococcus sp. PF-2]